MFQAAQQILLSSHNEDPDLHRKVYFRLSQVEHEMTYAIKMELLREKERHMDKAEQYIEAALREARKLNRVGLGEHIMFEKRCMHGRRIELKAKKPNPDQRPTAAEVDAAMQNITTEMRHFEESDRGKFLENRENGHWWLERLEKLKRSL